MTEQVDTTQGLPALPGKRELLDELEVVIGHKEGDLTRALSRLDNWANSISGELGHYLQRRSYLKAHASVEVSLSKEDSRGRE